MSGSHPSAATLMIEKNHTYHLPPLPYDFNALEPVIHAEIMELHYTKHHQAYVTNLNKALEQYHEAESQNDLTRMISLEPLIRFNGGGHLNHSFFWNHLASPKHGGGEIPSGPLFDEIKREFGSLEHLIHEMSQKTIAIQGSGWGWLGYHKQKRRLEITTCDNQDPVTYKGLIPLLGIDVWEHAYYLQYKNLRADYVKAIWNIIHWGQVAHSFANAST